MKEDSRAPDYTGGDLSKANDLKGYITYPREKQDSKLSNEASESQVVG